MTRNITWRQWCTPELAEAYYPEFGYGWGETEPTLLPDFDRTWEQLKQDPTPFMMLRALTN